MESVEHSLMKEWDKQTLIDIHKSVQKKINEEMERNFGKIWIMIKHAVYNNEKKIKFKIGTYDVIENHYDTFLSRVKKAGLHYSKDNLNHVIEFRLYDTPSNILGNPLVEDKY